MFLKLYYSSVDLSIKHVCWVHVENFLLTFFPYLLFIGTLVAIMGTVHFLFCVQYYDNSDISIGITNVYIEKLWVKFWSASDQWKATLPGKKGNTVNKPNLTLTGLVQIFCKFLFRDDIEHNKASLTRIYPK